MNTDNLIEKWLKSLCHANANYQMIALEKIAQYENGVSHDLVSQALSLANPSRKPSFFNKNHRVFEVLIKKGMIRTRQDPQELVYVLNLTKPTNEDRQKVRKAAIKARKKYEADHK